MGKTTEEALRIIKKAENEIIRLDTQSESALKTLKEKYKINSIEEGDKVLDKMEVEIAALEAKREKQRIYLEESFPWE